MPHQHRHGLGEGEPHTRAQGAGPAEAPGARRALGLDRRLNKPPKRYLALYGSLMAGVGGLDRLGCSGSLAYVGPCQISGRLVDLGPYPGLILGGGIVEAELYEVIDDSVLGRLDRYEGHDPRDPSRSLFVRRKLRLLKPPRDAWVFVYNRNSAGKPIVEAGSWKRHLEAMARNRRL
ncbi:MAG TPA: gamma-glutamylcyclotransferase family protein [Actinomycetota bacterium]|nr:gamma-glutamylcyclotransferase family protein [Actinomycetota bacterium]